MQREMPLISSMQGAPKQAPPKLVRKVDTEAQAIDVSIRLCGFKAGYVAASLGCTEAYVSLLRNGKRPIPAHDKRDHFIAEFCRITGTLLLAQVIRRNEMEADDQGDLSYGAINARIACELRQHQAA